MYFNVCSLQKLSRIEVGSAVVLDFDIIKKYKRSGAVKVQYNAKKVKPQSC
jgi:hypothetical protein